jgi:class 3 adenylate cyclase/tetratricopeptide (TPR) repeat protein
MSEIRKWLESIGLGQYADAFETNDIDMDLLRQIDDQALRELGMTSTGHRLRIRNAIAKLAPAPAADANLSPTTPKHETTAASAERRQLTVMFCDLVGSTTLSARLDPEDLRGIIGAYHRCCTKLVERNGGFVAKYMGDGVLAYFGYPRAHEHDAERAVRAGLDLVEAVPKLATNAGSPLQVRIGIATGLVVVGDLIGAGAAQEQAVVGETPNLAARLQAVAEPGTVVISASTRQLTGGLFEYRDLGIVAIKGFAENVPAWQVLSVSAAESRFEALRATTTPLVGRDEEIEILMRRWEQAKQGEGCVVLISGEPGIGKSRIAQTALGRLAGEPHTRLRYFCSPHHQDIALYPSITQLERVSGFRREDTNEQRLVKLEAVLSQATNDLREALPLLAELLSIPTGDRYPLSDLTPQKRKEKTLHAQLAQVEGLAGHQPVLMVYEDVHWSDPTTRESLDLLVDRVSALRALVIITFRPEFTPPWIGRPYVTMLNLNRLRSRRCAEMIAHTMGGKALPKEIIDQIIDRTDGVPLFIEELTKAVVESDMLTNVGDRYILAGPLPSLSIPTSLNASLLARLDRLAPVREVAQIGAAVGRSFSHELISAVTLIPQPQLDDALGQLVSAELIFRRGSPPNAEYTFKHALVQDAAYDTLLRSRRQQIHARIAMTLESQFPEIAASHPAVLADHFTKGSLTEEALKYWIAAADFAERRGLIQEAVTHYRAAVALFSPDLPAALCAQKPELLMKLGSALQQVEGYRSAASLQCYQDARKLAGTLNQLENYAKAGIGLAPLLFVGCHYQEALRALGEISGHSLDQLEPQIRVRLLTMSAVAKFGIGEYNTAWMQAAEAYALDDESPCTHRNPIGGGDPAIVARGYAGAVGGPLGRFDQCLSLGEAALAIARERGHAFTLAWALMSNARLQRLLGRFTDVLSLGNEAIGICERHGFHSRLGTVFMSTGSAYFGLGEIERGLTEIRRGLDLWRKTSGFHMSWYLGDFADCLVRAEKYDEADSVIREAEQIVSETDERSHVAKILRLRGLLSASRGNITDAHIRYLQAIEWSRFRDVKVFELRAVRDLARLQFLADQSEQAVKGLQTIIAWFPAALEIPDLREARELLWSHSGT